MYLNNEEFRKSLNAHVLPLFLVWK